MVLPSLGPFQPTNMKTKHQSIFSYIKLPNFQKQGNAFHIKEIKRTIINHTNRRSKTSPKYQMNSNKREKEKIPKIKTNNLKIEEKMGINYLNILGSNIRRITNRDFVSDMK